MPILLHADCSCAGQGERNAPHGPTPAQRRALRRWGHHEHLVLRWRLQLYLRARRRTPGAEACCSVHGVPGGCLTPAAKRHRCAGDYADADPCTTQVFAPVAVASPSDLLAVGKQAPTSLDPCRAHVYQASGTLVTCVRSVNYGWATLATYASCFCWRPRIIASCARYARAYMLMLVVVLQEAPHRCSKRGPCRSRGWAGR
jgi:hypothetical protein